MMLKRTSIAMFALTCVSLAALTVASPAQDKTVAVRLSAMEEQMRQLYGQIEELSLQVQQLNQELQRLRSAGPVGSNDLGGGGAVKPQPQVAEQDGVAVITPDPLETEGYATSIERIEPDNELQAYQMGELDQMGATADGGGQPVEAAPGPKPLGYLPGSGMNAAPIPNSESGAGADDTYTPNEVETASLDPSTMAGASPEQLYEKSYESLLRRRYGEAEAGFRTFVERYKEHELAGNAEFWLGETYYVQSDYKRAAQAFLAGYQSYPENRKAADSLLKLGMSLKQLGQKDQACAAFVTVGQKYPKAAETLKRAQNESTKAGC